MKNMARLAGALAVVGVFALTGCGKKLDNSSVENGVRDKLAAEGVTVTSVSCPKDREVKKGDTFECTVAVSSGQTLNVTLEQTDDSGTLSIDVANQVVDGKAIATQLEGQLTSGSNSVTVTCPPAPIAPGGNGSFECTAVGSDGSSTTFVINVKDGQIDFSQATTQ